MKKFIDYTYFMGMHSFDEKNRIICKNFIIDNLKKELFMSLENVGKCDDIVWEFSTKKQDMYYPFMDRIHTVMNIRRVPYTNKVFNDRKSYNKINFFQELTISQVGKEKLYTLDKKILALGLSNVNNIKKIEKEKKFPKELEKLYQKSLSLRLKIG